MKLNLEKLRDFTETFGLLKDRKKAEKEVGCRIFMELEAANNDPKLFSWYVHEEIGRQIGTKFDNFEGLSFLDHMYEGYVMALIPKVVQYLDTIWTKQDTKSKWYGDMDWTIRKIKETKALRVFTLKDHCTCGHDYYIVIEDVKRQQVHIRAIHQRGDYPKADYPKALNLRFWKERDYDVSYKNFPNTKLNQVYGDGRDEGYVLSFTYSSFMPGTDDANIHHYAQQRYFISRLESTCLELTQTEDD